VGKLKIWKFWEFGDWKNKSLLWKNDSSEEEEGVFCLTEGEGS
jgi:hypothetical protein